MKQRALVSFVIIALVLAGIVWFTSSQLDFREERPQEPLISLREETDKETDKHQDSLEKPNVKPGQTLKVPKTRRSKAKDGIQPRPFTVLLLGVDDRQGNFVGRSDVIMLAIVRPQDPSVTLLSIPRDTYAPIANRGTYEKINHAYAYGKETALATIENFLDIPIDYYVAVNFKGFIQLIDLLGGIRLNVERDVSYQHRYDGNQALFVHKGEQVLSGEEALLYVRFRSDAEGDFGRNRRQQQVIRALVDQAVDIRNITKLADIMGIVVKHVRTNLPVLDMVRLVHQLSTLTSEQVETISVKADVGNIRGISYVFIDEEERLRLQQELKRRLE
ncbi:LCP family protein required for cell wall assembly [Caldalkalibacillus uzonensis]|uniref:LCP family protein required for cell wall assembly n=1 Tax=Caldalkalibacillus uzonensis TaxID=353224 RepID=A0ABU0CTX7_9BACI|nr:LCP family protein [Caldalkalibacillus uzonensis]MDQ0339883.1 LCP family protein required for cell wall assembly [Caldalkalibacillus uzonensis]